MSLNSFSSSAERALPKPSDRNSLKANPKQKARPRVGSFEEPHLSKKNAEKKADQNYSLNQPESSDSISKPKASTSQALKSEGLSELKSVKKDLFSSLLKKIDRDVGRDFQRKQSYNCIMDELPVRVYFIRDRLESQTLSQENCFGQSSSQPSTTNCGQDSSIVTFQEFARLVEDCKELCDIGETRKLRRSLKTTNKDNLIFKTPETGPENVRVSFKLILRPYSL